MVARRDHEDGRVAGKLEQRFAPQSQVLPPRPPFDQVADGDREVQRRRIMYDDQRDAIADSLGANTSLQSTAIGHEHTIDRQQSIADVNARSAAGESATTRVMRV